MKRISIIEYVASFVINSDNHLLILWTDKNKSETLNSLYKGNETKVGFYIIRNIFGSYALQKEGSSLIEIFDSKGLFEKEIIGDFNLSSIKPIDDNFFLIPNRETKTYWKINRELNVIDTNTFVKINYCVEKWLLYKTSTSLIFKVFPSDLELWQTDLSQIGANIKLDNSKANNNEIDGELFGSETLGLVYVPMAGGQLVALDINTGNVVWVCSTKGNGRYAIFEDKIYKESDNLYVIDAASGAIIQQKDFEQIIPEYFVPSGPVWVYPDVLILLSVREAKVALLNRETLELEDLVHIPNVPGIPHSKDVIVWNDNKLYVLDMERTLHIFEKE
jgi:hypothetical protein